MKHLGISDATYMFLMPSSLMQPTCFSMPSSGGGFIDKGNLSTVAVGEDYLHLNPSNYNAGNFLAGLGARR